MAVSRTISAAELDYVRRVSVRESDVQRRLRQATERLPNGTMAATPEAAQLLALLVQAIGARRVVEVGVFTGVTTLAMALAMPEDGTTIGCDIASAAAANEIARQHWEEAGVAGRIELRVAPATKTLDALLEAGGAGRVDLVFIDADKESYDAYYERALTLVRPRGLIVLDNMLWYGSVADDADRDRSTLALRTLNEKLRGDGRIALSMLPLGDGLTLACKRPE